MKLSQRALKLIKYVMTFNGEEEVGQDGKTVKSPLRLAHEEASQRRHFFKAIDQVEKDSDKAINDAVTPHNEMVTKLREEQEKSLPQLDGETKEAYEKRITSLIERLPSVVESMNNVKAKLEELFNQELEFTITDKTKEVLKKYFNQFGEKVGFTSGDDEAVAYLEEALK